MKYNICMTTMRKEMNRKLQKIRSDAPHGGEPLPEAEDDRLWRKCKLEWRPLLKSFAVLMLATGAAALLDSYFVENNNVSIIYTLAIVVVASITPGYIYGIIASIISVIGVNYFFAEPKFGFNFTQTGYPITFASLLVVSIIMSTLMTRYREAAHVARLREMRTKALYALTNEFLAADDADSYVRAHCLRASFKGMRSTGMLCAGGGSASRERAGLHYAAG